MTNTTDKPSGIKRRGFASMTPERRAEIARMGGAAVPADRRSFSQNKELARAAASKGGQASKRPSKKDAGE